MVHATFKRPSHESQLGTIWCRNPNNAPLFSEKLFTKSDYFRCRMTCFNGYYPKVETDADGEFERHIHKWESATLFMSKMQFENCKHVCDLFFNITEETKHVPRKFVMDRKIKFAGQNELASDYGGLRVEALERFNDNWLSIIVKNYPALFMKKMIFVSLFLTCQRIKKIRS